MREIKITLSTSHHNIIRSLSPYISPSSSEVKVLREFCEVAASTLRLGVSGGLINSMAGTFTSTSLYMAPESLSRHEYTIQSDVWSMDISLLELIQNRFPFPSDLAAIELTMYITQSELPELENEGPFTYSTEMNEFIKLVLTRNAALCPMPASLLQHPWIKNVKQHEADMAIWIRKVWPGWPKCRGPGQRCRR
ncbi:kinase-like domain-containing protein [Fomitopsis serialis]|uniref:kinase-like domain-containing protein n=1 Tax=Fomitopsis serialis TaxID=139415 RepID=UPI002008608C|nr:kinase-like domain-containing protein [Neoantrodia serialis]KAH9912327.1 kinase-like domain-containing protein [Neoantrodia serialis]